MLQTYRRVLSVPGAASFSLTGLVARMPIAMFSLGIVLLVSEVTGSYGLAGSVSAAYLVANAVCAVPVGRLIDRLGQALVLSVTVSVCSAAIGLLMVAVWTHQPLWTVFAAAVVAGVSFPPVGSCVRARWSHVLDDPARVQTAFAFEGVVDEAVFILGPILVTVLATSAHPLAGLATAVAAGFLGTWALAAQRGTEPPARPRAIQGYDTVPMPWRSVLPVAAVCLMLGAFFGSAEVAAVAFAEERGDKGAAGYLLALWAFGSLAAGLISGVVNWRRGPAARVRVGTVALIVAMVPMLAITSMPLMAAALFVAGFAIAPTMIAALTLIENVVPGGRLTEGMAIVHTGLVAGVAPGATLAGVVIDNGGANPAFGVTVGAAALAALAAQIIPRSSAGAGLGS